MEKLTIEQIKEEAEKTWNFHNAHDVSTNRYKGVMCVSEAKKIFDKLLNYIEDTK